MILYSRVRVREGSDNMHSMYLCFCGFLLVIFLVTLIVHSKGDKQFQKVLFLPFYTGYDYRYLVNLFIGHFLNHFLNFYFQVFVFPCEFFTAALPVGTSLWSREQEISSFLDSSENSVELHNDVVWMVTILPLISS